MQKRAIILDCDPGQDDAINLLLAMCSPDEFEILGITTVAGNVRVELTARNARLVCDIANRHDLRVFAGCSRPMHRELYTAENIHGKSGVSGLEIIEPRQCLETMHAVDFLISTLLSADDNSIILVPTGPLTNIATAITRNPSISAKIAQIVLMGGALREGGNCTPSAEFNMFVDPHAADIVFRCGRPIAVLGLDVTYQALATAERRARIRALTTNVGRAAAAILDSHDRNDVTGRGAPLHDPCTIAYLLRPELFIGKRCNLSVETDSMLTIGHTAVDFRQVTDRVPNVDWIYAIDSDGFYDLLVERLSQ